MPDFIKETRHGTVLIVLQSGCSLKILSDPFTYLGKVYSFDTTLNRDENGLWGPAAGGGLWLFNVTVNTQEDRDRARRYLRIYTVALARLFEKEHAQDLLIQKLEDTRMKLEDLWDQSQDLSQQLWSTEQAYMKAMEEWKVLRAQVSWEKE